MSIFLTYKLVEKIDKVKFQFALAPRTVKGETLHLDNRDDSSAARRAKGRKMKRRVAIPWRPMSGG
ncbi:hypothetical protein [Marivivens donghaensis]|uniref:hypothetical protein n=1 Tax=Marivivens donghaensis TaxID=1699413 RepID=UPI00201EDBB7|nr:hypothetical protein [Marivivens donghaensis]MCL7410047.1 hypothetical protein [Marivivens donghaensis]MDN3705352.1 hypothetical protein [Marivivens donghaensis]